jgi:hypothetical protein
VVSRAASPRRTRRQLSPPGAPPDGRVEVGGGVTGGLLVAASTAPVSVVDVASTLLDSVVVVDAVVVVGTVVVDVVD